MYDNTKLFIQSERVIEKFFLFELDKKHKCLHFNYNYMRIEEPFVFFTFFSFSLLYNLDRLGSEKYMVVKSNTSSSV